ncbi:VolA/Pla-1 family phospholipase [Colwellia piezophila]|uniref:VolA/Pla-1 family phospholipase n=1 Tax=Colwellia piezophila TaxID=211668 RepID=UPI00036A06CC|nr:VolA/Pla-1 family phospholipase [Colwellia piezophila]
MKKLALSLAIISALGLSACDSETIEDVQKEVAENGSAVKSLARIVFDPGADEPRLSVPNDLLFSGSQDGTLNLPVADATDFSDPKVAMSALDGWSTTNPFVLAIDFPAGTSLDAASVFSGDSVKVYETLMGGDSSDAGCAVVTRGLACKVVGELTFGIDFIAQAKGNSIAIVPLKPLKGKTGYVVALTNNLKDSNANSIAGSATYEAVRQDKDINPLVTPSQLQLQGIINSYEKAIIDAGADKDSLIYTFAMTTQSTTDVLFTVKSLLAAPLAQGGLPPIISVTNAGYSVAQAFTAQGMVLSPQLDALYSTAQMYQGSITLPYYSGIPTQANPMAPVNDWWKALCDSGAMLAGLAAANPGAIPEGPLSESDGVCMAVSAAAGLPAPGLRDLSSVMPVDVERNLTKYSPVPAPRTMMPIDVQMTTPVISPVTDAVRANYGLPALTAEPDNGWPVVILQHGITSKKEDMLAITGILSAFGFATVAIDHPLHGSRGFDITGPAGIPDGIDDINASTVSATHYMNLASLLTTRDNLRQSASDMLGLRLGLNAVMDTGNGIKIDGKNVHFLGHSLGAITGINLVALANAPLDPAIDPAFKITSNSQAMPGVMIANLLMESGAFGDVIKSGLTYQSSPDFKTMVDAAYPPAEGGASETELVGAYLAFYTALTPEQQAGLNAVFSQFVFAAQTVTDAGDPANYAGIIQATQTPTHLIEVVGNGVDSNGGQCKDILVTDNCSDQVIPNVVTTTPFGGTEGAIALLGLPGVSSTAEGSGAVRFIYGHHGSILNPAPDNTSVQDPLVMGAVTQEMQGQVAVFFATMGQKITVTNTDLVK